MSVSVPVVDIESIDFLALDESGVVDYAIDAVREGRGLRLLTVNVDILQSLKRSPAYREVVGDDYEAVADGMPIVWASRLMGTPLPGRVTGADLIVSLTAAAASAGMRVLLLGGDGGSADAARLELVRRGAAIEQLAAIELPNPMSFESAFLAQLASDVETAKADVVFVSLGSEKGERLISSARHALPKACWLNVGAAFDFLAGRVERAPGHVQDAGLEWLHRLTREPGRLAKRYLVDDGPFALGMLARSAARRRAGGVR